MAKSAKAQQIKAAHKERIQASVGANGATDNAPEAASAQTKPPDYRTAGVDMVKNYRRIPLGSIVPDPDQVRKDFSSPAFVEIFEITVESMRSRGQLVPAEVRLRPDLGKFMLVHGETRWRAAQAAGLSHLVCQVDEREVSQADRLIEQVVDNNLRRSNTDEELAMAMRNLMVLRPEVSQNEAARSFGLSKNKASRCLALLSLAPEVRDQVRAGELSSHAATQLARLESPDDQVAVAQQVVAEKLTGAEAATVAQALVEQRRQEKEANLAPASGTVTEGEGNGEPITEVSGETFERGTAADAVQPSKGAAQKGVGRAGAKAPGKPRAEKIKFRQFTWGEYIVTVEHPKEIKIGKTIAALENAISLVRQDAELLGT